MPRLILAAIVTSFVLACGSTSTSSRDRARPEARLEAGAPTTAVARFASEPAGKPDVGAARLEVRKAGHVHLPQGRLAVSDAFVNDYPIVVADLPSGTHPVEVLIANAEGDARIAAARLRVRNEPVALWRRAGLIAIDSGNAAFFDPRISSTITPSSVEGFNDRLLGALEVSYRQTYSVAAISWEAMTLLAFSTGFGDGRYPVFVGATATGLPAIVLVDCEILPWHQ